MRGLKPIGTEFDHVFDASPNSTDWRRTKVRYRVLDHVLAQSTQNLGKIELMEELEALEVTKLEN